MNIPLPVLLVLVVGGVSLVVVITHLMGWSAQARLTREQVRSQLALDLPDAVVTGIDLAADHHAALVSLEQGAAVVFVLGDRLVSRRLPDHPHIKATDTGLRLLLPDPACPKVDVALTDAGTRQQWLSRLQ